MRTEFKEVTPAYAKELLKGNRMNRLLSEQKINDYCRQMIAGLWKEETGEAIKIASDGSLLDGQHRLEALIKANVTIQFLIISGLEKEIFSVLDSGKVRSAGDVLHIAGISNANNTAAAIRKYVKLKTGQTLGRDLRSFSNSEILTLYKNRSKFWDAAVSMGEKWYSDSKRILTMSDLIGIYAHFYDIDPDDAFRFLTMFTSGISLERDNPIYLLREKLLFAKLNTRFNLIQSVKTALIIKAWNHFRSGKKIKRLKFDIERDEFPTAI